MSRCIYSKEGEREYFKDNVERYYKEREEAFIEFLTEQAKEYLERKGEEEISTDEFIEELGEFHFPGAAEWLSSEYESALDECAERAYEE